MITLNHYLWVSGLLFAIGIAGIVWRRNALVVFMALEMNLNAANLALWPFPGSPSRRRPGPGVLRHRHRRRRGRRRPGDHRRLVRHQHTSAWMN